MLADGAGRRRDVRIVVHTAAGAERWTASAASLPLDRTPGSPWLLIPPPVRAAFDALCESGVALADTALAPPLLGVKCGCNGAFLVTLDAPGLDAGGTDAGLVAVRASGPDDAEVPARRGWVERGTLRPVVRGQTLERWGRAPIESLCAAAPDTPRGPAEWIIWTHELDPADGGACADLPPYAGHWLAHWRHRLAARSDTRGRLPWWTLFRTESASCTQPRVVWSDLGRVPRAAVLPAQDPTVPLNSCYVVRAPDLVDAQALTTLLNSAPAAAWLNAVAEPARGGYRRYLGWTVALLPLPQPWERARIALAPIAARAARGTPPSASHLTATVAAAYGVDLATIEPLLRWAES